MDIAAAIEKNRNALLRLVIGWLIVASLLGARRDRVLPRRIGNWISTLIFKAERATYYLRLATASTGAIQHSAIEHAEPIWSAAPLTIGTAIIRLKALRKALINLGYCIKRSASNRSPAQTACIDKSANFACDLPDGLGSQRPVIACRAPPENSAFFDDSIAA